jgi:hypothetical protein
MLTDEELREAGGMMSDGDLWVKLRREHPNATEEQVRETVREVERRTEAVKSQMSDQNKLNITDHLNQRRLKYGIVDGAFSSMPTDDRVFVYQIDKVEGDKFYEGGVLTRPDVIADSDRRQSHKGVLCSWGLKAQDELAPYDYRLGDIVCFIQMAPWKLVIGSVLGKEEYVLVLRAGHMVANDDAEERRRSGLTLYKRIPIDVNGGTTLIKHRVVGETNKALEIEQPVVMEEY